MRLNYSVNDVARVLGLTPGALHYYEREGLIKAKKEPNGRRYYDIADLWRLLSYEKYHQMEFPIKTVISQFSVDGGKLETIEQRVRDKRDEALEKRRYFERLAKYIDVHLAGIKLISELLGKYAFDRAPSMLFLYDAESGWISKNRKAQAISQSWVKAMPATRLSVLLPAEDYDKVESGVDAVFGYSAFPETVKELELPTGLNTRRFPPVSCLHTIVGREHDFVFDPKSAFTEALEYAKNRGFKLAGCPWGTIVVVECCPEKPFMAYIELWIPIE